MKKLINVLIAFSIITISIVLFVINLETVRTWPIIKGFFPTVTGEPHSSALSKTPDFNSAKDKNGDFVGFLSWDGKFTDLNVVGTTDNNFYLLRNENRNFDGSGAVFLDKSYRGVLGKVNVLYGRSAAELFGPIKSELNSQGKERLYFFDGKNTREYKVFSAFKSSSGQEIFNTFPQNNRQISKMISDLNAKSQKNYEIPLKGKNELLILCSYKKDLSGIQTVICALRIK